VTRLLDEHTAMRADNSRKIWALLAFALWFDRYGAPTTSPARVAREA
jgi:hypothetical protein